jgi:hypothetical protein
MALVEVKRSSSCSKCGAPIAFHKNRNGKWFPVDVFFFNGREVYRTGYGNYHNMTMWHVCREQLPEPTPVQDQTEYQKLGAEWMRLAAPLMQAGNIEELTALNAEWEPRLRECAERCGITI